ncbi:MAG: AI-2E family transporter [Deltaproteobacteria bacterium]|nr:AI-2E family transporter [Deltaproteobacteria bacterium]
MTRDNLVLAFFFSVFFFLFYQLYLILVPFAAPLILASILVVTLSPVTNRVRKALRGARTPTAMAMLVGTAVVVLVPMVFLLVILADQAAEIYERIKEGGETPLAAPESWLGAMQAWFVERFPALASLDFGKIASQASRQIAGFIATESRAIVQGMASGVLGLSMMLVALFFLFRDGDSIAANVGGLIPMRPAYKERLSKRVVDTVAAVVQSTVMIAVLQGFVGGLGYALIGGFSVSVLLGFLTGVASLVPIVGAALVWVPAALYLFAADELLRGGGLVLWGVLVVGSVDNFVRPLLIGGRVEIPTFLLLFALLGGLQVYGFLGIFIAPVVVALLLAFVEIYREHYVAAESQ